MSDSPAPQFTESDIAAAIALVSQDLDGTVKEVVTLTDEELWAVDGVQHDPITALPWTEKNAPADAERDLAAAVAMRSLLARGLVVSSAVTDPLPDSPADQGPPVYEVVPQVRGAAVARRTSDRVMIAERKTEHGTVWAYFHLFDLPVGRRALLEVFGGAGFHLFYLFEGDQLPAQFLKVVDPQGVVGHEDGQPTEVPTASFGESAEAERLASARAMTQVLVIERGADTASQFVVFAMPDGLELMENDVDSGISRVGAVSEQGLADVLDQVLPSTDV